ncbi:MAG: AAA family ATPase [Clostridia bacterium]|nr:AAA family ATPase [Clostridia bacterium]
MKLLSCVIQGFGKFRSIKIDFPDLTCLCEENGYGKTTLAAFLKAMFYGMDSSKKNSKFNDRAHYLPFDGGPYGGTVLFEYNGLRYRVKRTFDASSSTKDTYDLTPERENAPYLADPLGEKIFGIDKASFERTIFITPQEIELTSTDSIRTMLNNFVEGSNDDTSLLQATDKLTKRANAYQSGKKSGLIYTEKARAESIRNDIINRNRISDSLQGKYEKLEGYDNAIAAKRREVSAAQTENTLRADWEHYDELTDAVYSARDSMEEISAKYPYGIPAIAEISSARKSLASCETAYAVLQKKTFTAEDEAQLADLSAKFSPAPPNEFLMNKIAEDVHVVQKADMEIATLSAHTPAETESALKRRFDGRLPDDATLEGLNGYEEQYRAADEAYSSAPDLVAAPQAPAGRRLSVIMLIIAAIVLVAGIGVCFAQLIAGIVLIAVGVIAAVTDGVLYFMKKPSNGDSAGSLNTGKLAYKDKRDEIGNRIGAIIMPYGYSFEGGVVFAVSSFKKDLETYMEYLNEENARAENMGQKQAARATAADALLVFFRKYGLEGDQFADNLSRLREMINTYNTLKERRNSSMKDENDTRASLQTHLNEVMAFCRKYALPSDNIDTIKGSLDAADNDSRRYSGYVETYNDAVSKANEFMSRKNLAPRPTGERVDIDAINAEITGLTKERGQLSLEINSAEKDIESREGLENDLEACNAKIARYTANYNIILKTRDALKAADDRLKDKYANPISGSFDKYEKLLQKSTGEKIYMTRDLTVRFEHDGNERGEEYLSSGQRAACALCYRLAILENMYSGEKPFLIMDDPFCYMDAAHFASSRALLMDLSRSFQIIYLTCHESRMI